MLHIFGQHAAAADQPSADAHQTQLINPFVLCLHSQDSCLVLVMLLMCCSFVVNVLSWLINPIVLGLNSQGSYLVLMILLMCCSFVASVLSWLINPIVLGSVILFVGFWLLITRGQLKRYYSESSKLKEEFDKYRREMQVKVELLPPLVCTTQLGPQGFPQDSPRSSPREPPYPVQLPLLLNDAVLHCAVLCCARLSCASCLNSHIFWHVTYLKPSPEACLSACSLPSAAILASSMFIMRL